MKTCFTTIVTPDRYQNYIPLYCLALRTWYDGDILIYLRGEVSKAVGSAIKDIPGVRLFQNMYTEYPNGISTTNALRFIIGETNLSQYDFSLITDIDLIILQDSWQWHLPTAKTRSFSGYHGAFTKPRRPEICPVWSGNFERVAGGFFCVTPEWFNRTRAARTKYGLALLDGRAGNYREEDEVILAHIIKGSNMKVPADKFYPRELRGVHLGDFKFNNRWLNMDKMKSFLTNKNCKLYLGLSQKPQWIETVKLLQDSFLDTILTRVLSHIRSRTGLEDV